MGGVESSAFFEFLLFLMISLYYAVQVHEKQGTGELRGDVAIIPLKDWLVLNEDGFTFLEVNAQ